MTVLVTGAAGFIGSHTAVRLLSRGEQVVGLDNLNGFYSPDRKRRNLEEVARHQTRSGQFQFVEGDVRDRALLAQLFGQHAFRSVIHLAAMVGVRGSIEKPWEYFDVNVNGTLNLLEAVRTIASSTPSGERPNFVLASTALVYGRTELIPFVETDAADRPLSPYAASKRAAEMLGFTYHHLHGLDFTAVRFFTVYGPRGRPEMIAYKWLDSAFGGGALPYHNDGQMHRDWTFIDDIVSGIVAASERRLGYQLINLGRGEPVLLADFVETLEFVAGRKAQLEPVPMPESDVRYTYADISKAQELLHYQPRISFEEGIQRFYSWYTDHVLAPGHGLGGQTVGGQTGGGQMSDGHATRERMGQGLAHQGPAHQSGSAAGSGEEG
jgi:UDP-glucuronate 4-epimerase